MATVPEHRYRERIIPASEWGEWEDYGPPPADARGRRLPLGAPGGGIGGVLEGIADGLGAVVGGIRGALAGVRARPQPEPEQRTTAEVLTSTVAPIAAIGLVGVGVYLAVR